MRRLKINANVTFCIWVLEWIAFITCLILWAIGSTTKIDVFLEVVVLWTYVILPHTYLMNTAHNKDRIIDQGLKSTIKNALSLPFRKNGVKDNLPWTLKGLCSTQESISEYSKNAEITSHSQEAKFNKLEINEKATSTVFTITENNVLRNKDEHLLGIEDLEPLSLPSTSKGVCESKEKKIFRNLQNENSESDIDEVSLNNADQIDIRKELLSFMYQNIDNDEVYLHYLLQLTDYERCSKEKLDDRKRFQIVVIENSELKRSTTWKKSKSKKKTISYTNDDKMKMKPIHVRNGFQMDKTSRSDRMMTSSNVFAKRKMLLENFNEYCQNDETYESFLTILLDFEENLINQ